MKKKTVVIQLITGLLALSLAAHAQQPSAEEIIKKHLAAVGPLGKHKSQAYKGSNKVRGLEGTVENYSKAPDKNYQKVDLKMVVQESGCDGTSAWKRDQGGFRELSGAELQQAKENALFAKTLRYKDSAVYSGYKLLGTEDVDGKKAYKVQFTMKSGASYVAYFDANSFLEVLRDSESALGATKVSRQIFYGDFRKVEDLTLPFEIRQVTPYNEAVIKIGSYTLDQDLKDSLFAPPKETAKPAAK